MPDLATRRLLRCVDQHEFSTEERPIGWRLDTDIRVRQSGDQKLQSDPFNLRRLHQEVHDGVSSRLTPAQIDEVVQGVKTRLSASLPKNSRPVKLDEWEPFAKKVGIQHAIRWIWDYEIRQEVEHQLREQEDRIAHVLYTVAYRGRTDHRTARDSGFHRAEDVLQAALVRVLS